MFRNVVVNRLQDNKLISFVHLRLYFADIKIIYSFLKVSCYNLYMVLYLYMVHASQEGKGTDLLISQNVSLNKNITL